MTIKDNTIYCGNCSEILKEFPDEYVDMVLTSPPYDSLRDYHGYHFPFIEIATELYRVTKPGGVVIWIVGDEVVGGSESGTSFKQALFFDSLGFRIHDTMIYEKNSSAFPARSTGNRYTQLFEYMFVFSKGKPKTANLLCDKENVWVGWTGFGKTTQRDKDGVLVENNKAPTPEKSPRGNIWKYNTGRNYTTKDDFAFEHPAMFPEPLVEDHILTWTEEGDIILDPMCGSGTTLKMAYQHNRKYIGIDMSHEYCKISEKRVVSTTRVARDLDSRLTPGRKVYKNMEGGEVENGGLF